MSFDTFKKCIDKVPSDVVIQFSGMSEPWLNPDCTKMLLYAYERGFEFRVFTTLAGMSIHDIDLIKSVPFTYFVVHLPDKDGLMKIKVDNNYLELIKKITTSNISNINYRVVGGDIHPDIKPLIDDNVFESNAYTRAGNLKGLDMPKRLPGIINCRVWDFKDNILLPNGDVVLCCFDYGLRHMLGNLLTSDYDSLFNSAEFHKVQNGCRDSSLDILCRHCEGAEIIGPKWRLLKGFLGKIAVKSLKKIAPHLIVSFVEPLNVNKLSKPNKNPKEKL